MAIEDTSPTVTDDVSLLSEGEDQLQIPSPEREKEEEKPSEEIDEEELLKDESPEEEEEESEGKRSTLESIKKEFPDIFKKFPELKTSYMRDKQFSEIFHTPEEAREYRSLADDFVSLRDDIISGTGEKLIPALKDADSLEKFSKSFLPNLFKADKEIHWKVILPILENSLRHCFNEGSRAKNDNLKHSAMFISDFLLGDMEIAEGKKTLIESEPKKDDSVKNERIQWENEKYNDFNIAVHEEIYNALRNEISKGLTQENLTPFMKNSIVRETIDKIVKEARKDKSYSDNLDRLWKDAKSNGYKKDDKSRIINASLARAKSLIPSLRRQLVTEALGSSPSEGQKKREIVERTKSRREPGSQGRSSVSRPPSAKQIDWKRTSDLDIMNDTPTLRK